MNMDQPSLPKLSKHFPILKITLLVALALVIVLTTLLVGSQLNPNCPSGLLTNQNDSYDAGWQAANQKLMGSGLLPPEASELLTIAGAITEISGNQIILQANPVVLNPLAAPAPESRTVNITSKTKIIKQVAKTPEQLAADNQAFNDATSKLKPGATPPTPPPPYTEEEIKLSDLKVGDRISVTSNVDIKFATDITASQINFTPLAAPPQP